MKAAPTTSPDDDRLLSADEREMVAATQPPALAEQSEAELQALGKRLRRARDRYRRISSQQQREMRGKAAPRGATPARENAGSVGKVDVLVEALKRITAALRKLRAPTQAATQAELARKALAAKQAAPPRQHPGAAATSGKGMPAAGGGKTMKLKASSRPTVRMDPREIGRVSKAGKVAQARRDK